MPKLNSLSRTEIITKRMDEMLNEMGDDYRKYVYALARSLVNELGKRKKNTGFGELSALELIYVLAETGLYREDLASDWYKKQLRQLYK